MFFLQSKRSVSSLSLHKLLREKAAEGQYDDELEKRHTKRGWRTCQISSCISETGMSPGAESGTKKKIQEKEREMGETGEGKG